MFATFAQFGRIVRTGYVFAREGVFGTVDLGAFPAPMRGTLRALRLLERRGPGRQVAPLSAALARLGPSYVKLGQFLATRPDLVGTKIAADLENLQDRMPPFPQEQAEDMVTLALGKPPGEAYESFGPPVAAVLAGSSRHRSRCVRRIDSLVVVGPLAYSVALLALG